MDLARIIVLILTYRYVILFPLACLEGPITSFVVGMLIAAGYFNPFIAYPIFIIGDVIPDAIYYGLGRYGSRKAFVTTSVAKLGITGDRSGVVHRLWHDHSFKTMALSKFAYGLSTPLLVSAGLVHMPFQKFVLYSFILSLLQYAVLMTLGYYFGSSFTLVSSLLTRIQIGIALVIVVAVLYYLFTKYVRKQIQLSEQKP